MKNKLISTLLILFLTAQPVLNAAWDKNEPAGTRNASDIDLYVIANNTALEGMLDEIQGFKNLKVVRDSATQVTVTADVLYIQSSGTIAAQESSVSEAIAITTSGASGLDTGAEASSTWYYVWIIRKSSDGTVNGLLSASATSPTMPSGYDQKTLVSVVRNNSSSDFVNFYQFGREYFYDDYNSLLATGSPASSFTDIDCSTAIPPISTLGKFNAKSLQNNGVATTTTIYFRPNGSSATGTIIFEMQDGHGAGGQGFGAYFEMPTDSSQIIEYKSETQQRGVYIAAVGFTLNI